MVGGTSGTGKMKHDNTTWLNADAALHKFSNAQHFLPPHESKAKDTT
jgi:hypothetical protein